MKVKKGEENKQDHLRKGVAGDWTNHFDDEVTEYFDKITGDLLDVAELELGGEEQPLQAELDSFLGAVRSGEPPEVTGEDGRRALHLAERIVSEIRSQSW